VFNIQWQKAGWILIGVCYLVTNNSLPKNNRFHFQSNVVKVNHIYESMCNECLCANFYVMWTTCNLCTLSCNVKSTLCNQYKWTTEITKTYWSVYTML
jgi:hypothetical protein